MSWGTRRRSRKMGIEFPRNQGRGVWEKDQNNVSTCHVEVGGALVSPEGWRRASTGASDSDPRQTPGSLSQTGVLPTDQGPPKLG